MTAKRQTFGDRMAALANRRHELFAQAIAGGETQQRAYELAGYRPSAQARKHASRLATKEDIKARAATLQERAAISTEVTIESIAAQLDADRALAARLGQASACVSATLGKAKLFGLITDKVQAAVTNFADVSDKPDPEARQHEKAAWDQEIAHTMQ